MSVFPMNYQPSRLSMKLVHILRHGDCRPVGVVAPPQHDLRRAAAEAGASQSSPCRSFLRYASGTSYLEPGTQLLKYPGTQVPMYSSAEAPKYTSVPLSTMSSLLCALYSGVERSVYYSRDARDRVASLIQSSKEFAFVTSIRLTTPASHMPHCHK